MKLYRTPSNEMNSSTTPTQEIWTINKISAFVAEEMLSVNNCHEYNLDRLTLFKADSND